MVKIAMVGLVGLVFLLVFFLTGLLGIIFIIVFTTFLFLCAILHNLAVNSGSEPGEDEELSGIHEGTIEDRERNYK